MLQPAGQVDGYRFVECAECGFAFCPEITASSMRELYRSGYHGVEDGAPETGWTDPGFLRPALDRLRPLGTLTILDFGSGESSVPDWLRS